LTPALDDALGSRQEELMDYETAGEIKRHFDVVAAGLRSDIQIVAEGLGANTDRLERVESRLDRVESRLDGVESKVWRLEGRMTEGFREIKMMIKPFVSRSDR
jgi:hypothetical protein